jgi:hypothetical protein
MAMAFLCSESFGSELADIVNIAGPHPRGIIAFCGQFVYLSTVILGFYLLVQQHVTSF